MFHFLYNRSLFHFKIVCENLKGIKFKSVLNEMYFLIADIPYGFHGALKQFSIEMNVLLVDTTFSFLGNIYFYFGDNK